MSRQSFRLIVAVVVATGLALPFALPDIAGVATWKIVLGVLGLFLYMAGSRRNPQPGQQRSQGGSN